MNPKHLEVAETGAGYHQPANVDDQHLLDCICGQKNQLASQTSLGTKEKSAMLAWMLKNGRFFTPVFLSGRYSPGIPNSCFINSQALITYSGPLVYV